MQPEPDTRWSALSELLPDVGTNGHSTLLAEKVGTLQLLLTPFAWTPLQRPLHCTERCSYCSLSLTTSPPMLWQFVKPLHCLEDFWACTTPSLPLPLADLCFSSH